MSEYAKIRLRKIRTAVIIIIFAALIVCILFAYFKITTGGRNVFKEARNVKLTINMLDIEYYSKGTTIFEPGKMHGMSEESLNRIRDILDIDGVIDIISYSNSKKMVTCFTYQTDHYKVTYTYDDNDGDSWDVDYFVNLYDY